MKESSPVALIPQRLYFIKKGPAKRGPFEHLTE